MSIYRKFDREPSSDVHAKPVKRDAALETAAPGAHRKGAPSDEPVPQTVAWAARLPRDIRPLVLMRSFPRIANFLAAHWTAPKSFRPYIDELFVDRRGDRQGFPPEVMAELFALRAFYEDLYPLTGRRWDDANKRG
jgi:hypothetical protein